MDTVTFKNNPTKISAKVFPKEEVHCQEVAKYVSREHIFQY